MAIYCLRISVAACPCTDIPAWISVWVSSLLWIIVDLHPKVMDIHVDIRGFLEIHAWICYGFSGQGNEESRHREDAVTAGISTGFVYGASRVPFRMKLS